MPPSWRASTGCPASSGCEIATKVIPDGARVRVDAGLGEVTLLS